MEYPSRDEIRSLCTEQSFQRGLTYWRQGRIQRWDIEDGRIDATVRGSSDYSVMVDLTDDRIATRCSCPYDYAGDCKHIVAVLLAIEDDQPDMESGSEDQPPGAVNVESLVAETPADDLRSFLLDVIRDETDIRDRFVAFAGGRTGKTLYDYKQELDRLFDDATSRRGMVEYDTHIDFSKYHDLATAHREKGRVDAATTIYRALGETIRENMDRIDDSGGYYGRELERAVDSYAETVGEADLDHDEKRPYIDYLFREFVDADYHFASDYYDDALRTLCTSRADHEYWLDLLADVTDITLDADTVGHRTNDHDEDTTAEPDDETAEAGSQEETADERERTDDILYASDFGAGPLTTDDFTGGTLDIDHLAVGPLEVEYFVGDAFDELHVDEPSTVERHTVDVESGGSTVTSEEIPSSLRTRRVVSTYIYLLEELDRTADLSRLYEQTYLEHKRFCKQYAERLIEDGHHDRALDVLEDGIDTFRSAPDLLWVAADLYRDRDPSQYRETLQRLFLDHGKWAAYDDLKAACDDAEWASRYEEFERRFETNDRQRLLDMYVHDGDLEKAFAELRDAETLSWLRRYRDPVATVDPAAYFEVYREQLLPFAANDTGRRHYREIIAHLEEMQDLVPAGRFEEFVDFLKETHANRPAFLDELDKADFE